MNISVLTTQIKMICYFTATIKDCMRTVKTLDHLKKLCDSDEELALVDKVKTKVFNKGQHMQMVKNAKELVGDL